MAKIIEEGKALNWERTKTCKSCETKFVVTVEDAEDLTRYQTVNGLVDCPVCGVENIIVDIPEHVRNKMKPSTSG